MGRRLNSSVGVSPYHYDGTSITPDVALLGELGCYRADKNENGGIRRTLWIKRTYLLPARLGALATAGVKPALHFSIPRTIT